MLTEQGTIILVLLFKILILYQCNIKYTVSPITLTGTTYRVADPTLVEFLEILLVEHDGINKLNGTFGFYGEMHFIEAEMSIDLDRLSNKQARIFYMKLDGCKFLKSKYKNNRLLELIRKGLMRSQSFLQTCPIPPHHPFKLELLDITDMYPIYLPNVTFTMTGKLYTRGHLLWEMNLTGFTKDNNRSKNVTASSI